MQPRAIHSLPNALNNQENDGGGSQGLGRAGLSTRPDARAGSGEKLTTRHFLLGQEDCRCERPNPCSKCHYRRTLPEKGPEMGDRARRTVLQEWPVIFFCSAMALGEILSSDGFPGLPPTSSPAGTVQGEAGPSPGSRPPCPTLPLPLNHPHSAPMIQGTSWSSGSQLASYIPTSGARMAWGPEGRRPVRGPGQARPIHPSMNLQPQARGGS